MSVRLSFLQKSLLAVFAVLLMLFSAPAFAATTTVYPSDMAVDFTDVGNNPEKWFFFDDEDAVNDIVPTIGSFVSGPGTPPEGGGSVQISVSGEERRNLATSQFGGIRIDEIEEMKFSTYNPVAGNNGSADRTAYLNFNVDFNYEPDSDPATPGPGIADGWQSRIIFTPGGNGAVQQDTWQEWDAINGNDGSGEAKWRWSRYAKGPDNAGGTDDDNSWPDGVTTEARTVTDLLTAFPDMQMLELYPWLGMRVGSPYQSGYTENLDAFVFKKTSDNEASVWDFEPQEDVRPILECVQDNFDGTYTAHFGYLNENLNPVGIPVGNDNKITGGGLSGQDQGQPTTFQPGRTDYQPDAEFTVVFNGSNLVWSLDGRTSTASSGSTKCDPVLTLKKEVVGAADPTLWTLKADITTTPVGNKTSAISGMHASDDVTTVAMSPGTYDLSEMDGPSGYTASDWVCTGGTQDDADTVTIAESEIIECTITNTFVPAPSSLKITKYLCPYGTIPNRDDNGVGETPPADCVPQEGQNFGYVYNPTQNNGAGPWDDFQDPIVAEGVTDENGMLVFEDLPTEGRYVVFETDGNGNKVDFETDDLLGLYCDGDADPDPTHNDNGDIALLTAGEVTECVAYNEAPEPTMATLTLIKEVIGEDAPDEEDEWTLTAGDPQNGGFEGTTGVSQSVDPGIYPLIETAGGDVGGSYTPSEWVCEGTGYSDDPDDYDSENNTITLEAGDNITCTIKNTYVPAPTTATVEICKEDLDGNRLDGWELFLTGEVDSFPVPANDPTGVDSDAVLASGVEYIVKASGIWKNGNVRYADAEYTSVDNSFAPPEDGAGGQGERNELQIDERFDADGNDWGPFNPTHTYEQTIDGNGATINLRVFEGTGTQQNSNWYDDNEGSLDVTISAQYSGTTQNGCVTFENVPLGTYEVSETLKPYWENISGLGELVVDQAQVTRTVVNKELESEVKLCKKDVSDAPLADWTLLLRKDAPIETVIVPTDQVAGADSVNTYDSGTSYIALASGEWVNGNNPQTAKNADAEYASLDGWASFQDGAAEAERMELQINQRFDADGNNWGPYNSNHVYAQSFVGDGTSVNLRVFDGAVPTPTEAWYNDNSGELSVQLWEGYTGVTDDEGCVTFSDVPYGIYTVDEILQEGWETVSGTEEVEVNEESEEFVVVNQEEKEDYKITVLKYLDDELAEEGTFNMKGSEGSYTLGDEGGYSEEFTVEDGYRYFWTMEKLNRNNETGYSCSFGKKYQLVGYTTGADIDEAKAKTPKMRIPRLFNIKEDHTIIVWNEKCPECDYDRIEELKGLIKDRRWEYVEDIRDWRKDRGEYRSWRAWLREYRKIKRKYYQDMKKLKSELEQLERLCNGWGK
jgi:hypothetical protein